MPAHDIASEHPGNDLLADLAAQDVLSPELAARVESHVQQCERCLSLLAEAEAVQGQLRHLPAEPMPADVALQLDQALAHALRNPAWDGRSASSSAAPPTAAMPVTPAPGAPGAPAVPPVVRASQTGELPTRRSLRQAAANTGEFETRALPVTDPGTRTGSTPAVGRGPADDRADDPFDFQDTTATSAGRTVTPRHDSATSTGSVPADGGPPAGPTPSGGVNTGPPTDMTRRIQIAGRPAAGPATGSTGRIDKPLARFGKAGREDKARSGARRQALEEQRSDEILDRRSRLAPMLRVAAGVVLVLVIGAGAVKVITGGGSGGDATTASDSAGSAASGLPVLAPVLATGTNYARAQLSGQVSTLVTQSQSQQYRSSTADESGGAKSLTAPEAAADGASANQNSASSDLLRSPAALRSCLSAIGEANIQPLAVDLARYGGRDAAILVLPPTGGGSGYSVWVVRRDCGPDNPDSVLDQIDVPAS